MPLTHNYCKESRVWDASKSKAKFLGGVLTGRAGSWTTIHFQQEDSAAEFVNWLKKQCYRVRSFKAPDENCQSFVVTYR